jgi:hypothetical protein
MEWYSRSRADFLELLYAKYRLMDYENYNWCLTLPEDMCDERDFKAEEAIKIDKTIKLPSSYSLWKWIYKTSNQWALWACTSLWTTHGVQILKVRQNGVEPTDRNIITPMRKDLRKKMGHSTEKYDGWDYVEKAVNVALKEWILIEENGQIAKFDWYATGEWNSDDASIDMMKRYLYNWNPIIWCVRWDKKMRSEMTAWQVKTIPTTPTGWHCIALVGWDEAGMRFVNSWSANDWKGLKSRFHIPYDILKKLWIRLNYRYRVLYIKEDANKDPEYIKRKNNYLLILKALKKIYPEETNNMKKSIEEFSRNCRRNYPEINKELPLN